MKKIIFLFLISLNSLFAIICVPSQPAPGDLTYPNAICQSDYFVLNITGCYNHITYKANGNPGRCTVFNQGYTTTTTPCPSGQVLDSHNECIVPAPPETCTWAVSPYTPVNVDKSVCLPSAPSYGNIDDITYYKYFKWCEPDTQCYAKEYSCPAGKKYSFNSNSCEYPVLPPLDECPGGQVYTRTKSVTVNGKEVCGTEIICKSNGKILKTSEVSCGAGPVLPDTTENPDPTPSQPADPWERPSDRSTECGTKRALVENQCQLPNVLKFFCDPKTGVATSSCTPPTNPTGPDQAPGDDTKGVTTKDIKDLATSLPSDIKKSLQDFLTDGSTPYLSSIKASLQSSTILQADANDLLGSLEASSHAQLNLQADTIDAVNGVKSSVNGLEGSIDGVKSSVDSLNDSLKSGMTDQEFGGFANSDQVVDAPDNSSLFDDIVDFGNQISGDASSISTQYDSAKTQISQGFAPVSLPTGSCNDLSFVIPGSGVSNTIPMSRIPSIIAPYGAIFALLVYATIMFFIFRFLFLFFISRSK